jgi:CRISPR/Cas system-associated exonuclease Cas4 (RecB family)
MKPFLKEVAEDLLRLYGRKLDELCLVFPNRRAGLFFNKYLGEKLEQPVWSPSIYTIQDLMSRISDLEYSDDLELISLLYKVYSEVSGRNESFDEFFYWGEVMLGDFDELDKYLVNSEDIFRNLADLKDLDSSFQYLTPEQLELISRFWSTFSSEQLSNQKQQFLEIWNILAPVYEKLRQMLLDSGTGYEGMIYRNVAERIGRGNAPDLPFTKIAFIGFNALNPCEQRLFKTLQNSKKALFYWDYDEYYLGNEMHEAGRFIRQNLSSFSDAGKDFNQMNLADSGKNLQVYSIPSDAGQAQIVHKILEEARVKTDLGEETAIVLADEELLIPVLNALPQDLKEINVTMGYPVSATPVFSLIEHLIALQRNIKGGKGKDIRFYYADVLPLIQHQYISLRQRKDAAGVVREIHEQNLIYLPPGKLEMNDLFKLVFRKIGHPEEIAGYLLSVLEMITGGDGEDEKQMPALELEFIYRIYTRIKRLKDVLGRLELNFTIPTFLRIFHKFLLRTRIPFSGEPLAGIQVMGVLETRVLDFDRVILLSLNEGAFPRTGTANSFIPHNLRMGFQLPTLEYQDAIYAYYFYRLIHRSSDIHLLYNNKAEGLTTGEKSRYIYQLKYDPTFNIIEWPAGFDIHSSSAGPLKAEKSPAVIEKLLEYCTGEDGKSKRYLSPSALNTYIDCPLQFYFNYVAVIREPIELQEEIDPALFGSILHESVREVYELLENPVEKSHLDAILNIPDKIRLAIDKAFRKVYFKDPVKVPEGRNRVIREIIFTYVEKILEKDKEYCPISIESLEKDYYLDLTLHKGEREFTIRVGGQIDRIDQLGHAYRVIDYKTGSGKMFFSSLGGLFDHEEKNRNRAAFQTLLYAKLLSANGKYNDKPVIPGVYLIRDIFTKGFSYHFSIGTSRNNTPVLDYADFDQEFTENLSALISSIFDADIDFLQTGQEEICRNCLYKDICHR